jgi:hypothetical protein
MVDATNANLSRDGKSIYIYSTSVTPGRDEKNCNGLLLWQLDCASLKLSKPLAYEFTPDVIEAICQKGGGSKHKREYYMYEFTPNLMELDNGNLVILGCPQQVSTSTYTSTNTNDYSKEIAITTFDVGPVISFFLNKAGKTFDYALIPRNISLSRSAVAGGMGVVHVVQSPGISRSYSGFAAANLGDEIVIIYNDGEDNLKRGDDEKVSETRSRGDLVLAEALISKDKKLQYRKQIGKSIGGKYSYFLGNAVPTSSSFIIFPIAKEGVEFNARKIFYSNWCFLDIK